MTGILIDSLAGIKKYVKGCVVLYSGGLDSTYFLYWAVKNGLDVVALHVHLNLESPDESIEYTAQKIGVKYLFIVDAVNEFVDEYISLGIKANCLYQNHFPVCSSFSRPLMARKAVEIAEREGYDCIVHTCGYHQNSASRFNLSIRSLAPNLNIGNPFLKEDISRAQKLQELGEVGLNKHLNVYSIDENIWGRVVENGLLDNPGNLVPEEVFIRTRSSKNAPTESKELTVKFLFGIPVAIDAQEMSLTKIIKCLSDVGSLYGVGRYNGLEDTPLGLKNHEVRESPAAAAIVQASQALSRATLTQRELRIKSMLDYEWIELVVGGSWFSSIKESLDAFMNVLTRNVSGSVTLRYSPGNVFVASINSLNCLDFENFKEDLEDDFLNFSYKEFFEINSAYLYKRVGSK